MHSKFRVIVGVIIILAGIIFMLDVLMLIDAGVIFHDYWPVLFILFGVFGVFDGKSSTFIGVILLLIGVYFQLNILDLELLENVELSQLILPVILIIIGAKILVKPKS